MTSLLAVTSQDIMNSGLNGLQIGACAVAAYGVARAANMLVHARLKTKNLEYDYFSISSLGFPEASALLTGEATVLFLSSYLPLTSRLTGRVTGQLLAGEVAAWAGTWMLGEKAGWQIKRLLQLSIALLSAGTVGGFYGKERAITLFAAAGAFMGIHDSYN